MGRSIRIATVVAILACTTPGWGQVQTKDRIITVRENGKDSVQCKVLKTWKEKDGSTVSQVQSLVTGEKFTMVEGEATPASPDGPTSSRMRIFNWSKKEASPASASVPPTTVVGTTEPPLPGTTRTSAPVIVKQIPTKVVTEETVVAPKGRPGFLGNVFGKSQPTTTTTTPAAVPSRETKSPPIQRTGGTVPPGDGSRSALPISTHPRQVDPIDFPDQYGPGSTITTVPTSPSKLSAVQKSGDIKLTSGSPTTVPTKPKVDILPAPGTNPVKTVSATSVSAAPTTTSECTACQSGPAKAGCSTCATASAAQPQRYGLLSRLRKSEPAETVVVQGTETVVPGVPTSAVAACTTCGPVEKVKAVKSVRVPTVKEERVVAHLPLPRNEGRIGAFSGMRASKPRPTAGSRLGNSDLPAGMSSVSAAGAPGVSEDTPVGAIVRTPDGQTMMVPYNQVASGMPAVPVNAPNAFSMSSPGVAMYTVNPDNVANAFGMAMPTRPVPADHGLSPNVPNAWAAMPGVPGAPGEPRAYSGQGYPVAMNYPTAPVGYYPPRAAYPMPQPMVHPGVMMPRGSAVASDLTPGSAPYLAALRLNVMPSERERAVEGLARCNWKADPQVVPALVMAAQTDPAPTVRVSCIRALGHMRANTAPTVEALQQMKEDRDPRVRLEVQQVLPLLMKP